MRNWLILIAVGLVGLAIVVGVRADDDPAFLFDRAARVERISLEIRQIEGEQRRLIDERQQLIRERGCAGRARSRSEMNQCARPR